MPGIEPSLFASLVHSIGALVGFAAPVATAVVIGALGRRYRPGSSGLLFRWSIAALAWSLLRGVLLQAMPAAIARSGGGVEAVQSIQAGFSLLGSVVHVVLTAVFLIGLARVMRDVPGTAPER